MRRASLIWAPAATMVVNWLSCGHFAPPTHDRLSPRVIEAARTARIAFLEEGAGTREAWATIHAEFVEVVSYLYVVNAPDDVMLAASRIAAELHWLAASDEDFAAHAKFPVLVPAVIGGPLAEIGILPPHGQK